MTLTQWVIHSVFFPAGSTNYPLLLYCLSTLHTTWHQSQRLPQSVHVISQKSLNHPILLAGNLKIPKNLACDRLLILPVSITYHPSTPSSCGRFPEPTIAHDLHLPLLATPPQLINRLSNRSSTSPILISIGASTPEPLFTTCPNDEPWFWVPALMQFFLLGMKVFVLCGWAVISLVTCSFCPFLLVARCYGWVGTTPPVLVDRPWLEWHDVWVSGGRQNLQPGCSNTPKARQTLRLQRSSRKNALNSTLVIVAQEILSCSSTFTNTGPPPSTSAVL